MNKRTFTVLGAEGFIGGALRDYLLLRGHFVYCPSRTLTLQQLRDNITGHVIYCIGLTGDFRERPDDTLKAHIGVLRYLLNTAEFSSMTYLSSARVYMNSTNGCEDAPLTVQPHIPDYFYNLSKLMGESLCNLAHLPNRPVRVVRLSNVVGGGLDADNFIHKLLRQAISTGVMQLQASLISARDYIALSDVTKILERIALYGKFKCYNLASGQLTTNKEIVEHIQYLTGATLKVCNSASATLFPRIDIQRISNEFQFHPLLPLASLRGLVSSNSD